MHVHHIQPCSGVKGLSPLHILPSFDIIDGVVIDYMHCLLEGIGKKLCTLWFAPSQHSYYIGRHAELIDKRLASIKPPDAVTRIPRGVTGRKHWKGGACTTIICVLICQFRNYTFYTANEYRAWILFYALPVLKGLLPDANHQHLALLVCSLHILLGDEISPHSLGTAQQLLTKFYRDFQELYGQSWH